MHSIVNIPHHDGDKHAVLTATTDRDHARVKRLMVAEAIRFAIVKGREAGYAQAKRDICKALGIK